MCRLHIFVLDSHLPTLWESNCPFGFPLVMFPLGSSVCVSFPLMSDGRCGIVVWFLIIAFPSILLMLAYLTTKAKYVYLFICVKIVG